MDATLPRDREIWIVTDEGNVRQVRFCHDTRLYTTQEVWRRTDGESGEWTAHEIAAWSDDYDEIEDLADQWIEDNGQFGVGA